MSTQQTLARLPGLPGHSGAGSLPLTQATARVVSKPDEAHRARLEQLVRDHHSFVWRSAQRLGLSAASTADIEDVVQDVFIIASGKLDDIRHERGFLFQTCVYVVGHMRRRAYRRREVADEERVHAEIDTRPGPEESAVDAEARVALQAVLDAMAEDLRVVFVLFELERLSMTEISEMIGIPPGTVASRLRRAREIFTSRVAAAERGGQ